MGIIQQCYAFNFLGTYHAIPGPCFKYSVLFLSQRGDEKRSEWAIFGLEHAASTNHNMDGEENGRRKYYLGERGDRVQFLSLFTEQANMLCRPFAATSPKQTLATASKITKMLLSPVSYRTKISTSHSNSWCLWCFLLTPKEKNKSRNAGMKPLTDMTDFGWGTHSKVSSAQ